MASDILMTNVKYWGTLGLSKIKAILIKTMGMTPYQDFFNIQLKNNPIINDAMDRIILNETQKLSSTREGPGFFGI